MEQMVGERTLRNFRISYLSPLWVFDDWFGGSQPEKAAAVLMSPSDGPPRNRQEQRQRYPIFPFSQGPRLPYHQFCTLSQYSLRRRGRSTHASVSAPPQFIAPGLRNSIGPAPRIVIGPRIGPSVRATLIGPDFSNPHRHRRPVRRCAFPFHDWVFVERKRALGMINSVHGYASPQEKEEEHRADQDEKKKRHGALRRFDTHHKC